uniref:Calcium uniporter protein n=1 Tax=Arcella intermedia TaxID=1963864 RepID=A0A6B2L5Z2_9EUKA
MLSTAAPQACPVAPAAPSAQPTPTPSPVPIQLIQRSGLINLILPLPNAEKCSFTLYPNKTVKDLITDIREEERPNSLVLLTDKNGNRISHETPISQLLNQPFNLVIDEELFSVEPFKIVQTTDNVLGNPDLLEIASHGYHEKIKAMLLKEATKRPFMNYSEYERWCEQFGMSKEKTHQLSKAFHKIGLVLHFHENSALKDIIFLKPSIVVDAIAANLNIKFQTREAPLLRSELHKLLPLYLPLNNVKQDLDVRAEKKAKRWMAGALAYLTVQFGLLARMVWIDFNWDIMEPITYFVGVFTMMGGYLFFVLYNEDYTYKALENRQRMLALKKLYISEEFNWQKWNALHQKVLTYTKLLNVDLEEEVKGLQSATIPKTLQ